MKNADFHSAVKAPIRAFPQDVKKAFGKAILELQNGVSLEFPLSRPMPSIGQGVHELRVKDRSGIYRILIFHAFKKKTQKTPKKEIDLGRQRLKEMLHEEEN